MRHEEEEEVVWNWKKTWQPWSWLWLYISIIITRFLHIQMCLYLFGHIRITSENFHLRWFCFTFFSSLSASEVKKNHDFIPGILNLPLTSCCFSLLLFVDIQIKYRFHFCLPITFIYTFKAHTIYVSQYIHSLPYWNLS